MKKFIRRAMGEDNAYNNRLKHLYHWQPYKFGRLRELLKTNSIYCSLPSSFNDPWDCSPQFDNTIPNSLIGNYLHKKWALKAYNKFFPAQDKNEEIRKILNDPQRSKHVIDQISEATVNVVRKSKYRIYCLSPNPENLLMWSHYANSHTGICIEYDLKKSMLFTALKCRYKTNYPSLKTYSENTRDLLAPLLIKSDVWSYEEEYRLILSSEIDEPLLSGHQFDPNGLLTLPKGAISSIIVGCDGPYEKIRKLVLKYAPEIKVKRAVKIPNKYAISIQE